MARRLQDQRDSVVGEITSALSSRPDATVLTARLNAGRDDSQSKRLSEAQVARKSRDDESREKNIALLTPELDYIRAGRQLNALAWASRLYLIDSRSDQPTGFDRVVYFSNTDIAAAIADGWTACIRQGVPDLDAATLGKGMDSQPTIFEMAALAGMNRLLTSAAPDFVEVVPLIVVLAVFKSAWILRDSEQRDAVERWALRRLNSEPNDGRTLFEAFLMAAIDAGVSHIEILGRIRDDDAHGPAVVEALDSLLDKRPDMPVPNLRAALRAAVKRVNVRRLLTLANNALANPAVLGEQKTIWMFMAFSLDPRKHGPQLLAEYKDDVHAPLYDSFRNHELEPADTVDPTARAEREGLIVPHGRPDRATRERREVPGGWQFQ